MSLFNKSYNYLFVLFLTVIFYSVPETYSQEYRVDYRYSPEYWYSAIGFPGDHHKTLVDDKGSLLYDFGPGPYVKPNTVISLGLVENQLSLAKQYYDDPRIPIVRTELQAQSQQVFLKTYSLIPDSFPSGDKADAPIWRSNGLTGTLSWASPPDSVDPAFRHVAWGTNRPIEYHVQVEKGRRKTIVLGFCESYRNKTGMRAHEMRVEGAEVKTVDFLDAGPANTPQVYSFSARDENNDGVLDIDILQAVPDPNTILNVIWVFPADYEPDKKALIRGELSQKAEIYLDAGREPQVVNRPPRFDVMEAELPGDTAPKLKLKTKRKLRFDEKTGILFSDGIAFVKSSPVPKRIEETENGFDLVFPSGTERVVVLVQNGFRTDPKIFPEFDEAQAADKIKKYWQEEAGIPYDHIIVPDSEMQGVLQASMRTFYQSSEVVDGYLQFQPGAALYRGLWIHDGVYFAELALQLGDMERAGQVVEGYLTHQHKTGQVEVMRPNNIHRETPLFLWLLCRYAELTGDDAWLKERWQHVETGINWLRHLREQTLSPGAPNYGLIPAGFADGGIHGVQPEYASVNWTLIALPKAVETASRLGKQKQATEWQQLYEEFLTSFKAAMHRDIQKDENGHMFLPIRVGAKSTNDVPQRGQWTITEALMHGKYLTPDEPLVQGTISMLESNTTQGLITSVGWLTDGIWVYYGGFLAEAYLELGEGKKAADIFYAMANHASMVATWPEEQMPKGEGRRTVGDYPHTWASSTMLRLAIRLLAYEDGDNLILLRGLPVEWLKPGSGTELQDIATRFGRVNLKLNVSDDGSEVNLSLRPLSPVGDGKIMLDMTSFKTAGFSRTSEKISPKWNKPLNITIKK